MNFKPTEAELLNTGFVRSTEKRANYKWVKQIKPFSHNTKGIIWNGRDGTFRYSRFLFNIQGVQDLEAMIRILSK